MEPAVMRWARRLAVVGGAVLTVKILQRAISAAHKIPEDPHELIEQAQAEAKEEAARTGKPQKKCLVIGTGITGIGALKSCLEEGMDVTCFERADKVAGFWRFTEEEGTPSVYKSVYIDTPRDINSYGDRPYDAGSPAFTHNSQLVNYLESNVKDFGLDRYITFRREVTWISRAADSPGMWSVLSRNVETGETFEDVFDGVLVCTGRHGASGYIPRFPGLDETPIKTLHSSMYKYPLKHGIDENSTVVVVGVGNSGLDIVTEVSQVAKKTHLVSRSGLWLSVTKPGELELCEAGLGRLAMDALFRFPWWWLSSLREGMVSKDQEILNKHGLKPQHRLQQQHELVTGMYGPTIHQQLEDGKILVHKSLVRFENDESGTPCVVLGGPRGEEKIAADVVVFATGFRSSVGFVDPEATADLRFNRRGTDVPLYKAFLAIPKSADDPNIPVAFINQVQTMTFMGSVMQARYYSRVIKGKIKLPPPEVQYQEMLDTRMALAAQYMDREQLRTQHGLGTLYYDELANDIGCLPTLGKLLTERPTALWHWYFGGTSLGFNPFQYHLVGPGAYRKSEEYIERLFKATLSGRWEAGPLKGELKPEQHWAKIMVIQSIVGAIMQGALLYAGLKGYATSFRIADRKKQNLEYVKAHGEEGMHSLEFGEDSSAMRSTTAGTSKVAASSEKFKSFRNDNLAAA